VLAHAARLRNRRGRLPIAYLHVFGCEVDAVALEARGDLTKDVAPVAVVGGAADPLGAAARNDRRPLVGVGPICCRRRWRHAEHVVHVQRTRARLRRRHDDSRAAEPAPAFDDRPFPSSIFDLADRSTQIVESHRFKVRQALALDRQNGRLARTPEHAPEHQITQPPMKTPPDHGSMLPSLI
jgi:hypothetical protein